VSGCRIASFSSCDVREASVNELLGPVLQPPAQYGSREKGGTGKVTSIGPPVWKGRRIIAGRAPGHILIIG